MDDGPFGNTTYDGPGSWSVNDHWREPMQDDRIRPGQRQVPQGDLRNDLPTKGCAYTIIVVGLLVLAWMLALITYAVVKVV